MTLGEKIKFYRSIQGITQEQFSKLSKIGISTVKKLETDLLKPKPEMLKKIADGLGVSINIFTDFDIETVSDVVSLITKMDEQVDMHFTADYDEDGNPIPKTIQISFDNPSINRSLADYIRIKNLQNEINSGKEQYTGEAEIEAIKRMDSNLEQARLQICQSPVIVSKKNKGNGISVKVFPPSSI